MVNEFDLTAVEIFEEFEGVPQNQWWIPHRWTRCADGALRISKRKLLYDFQGALWNESVKAAAENSDGLVQPPSVARPENHGKRDRTDYSYGHLGL